MPKVLESLPLDADAYDHVVLSPHFDDAALSCGGTIASETASGQSVLVVTACAGASPKGADLGPLARAFHANFTVTEAEGEIVAVRRAEDRAAMEVMGADVIWLGHLDAIYRMPQAYTDEHQLFGTVSADDTLTAGVLLDMQRVYESCPTATFYGPLGVGNHVDHQQCCMVMLELAAQGARVFLYEDFPYAQRTDAVEQRLQALELTPALAPALQPIGGTLERKIEAIACYRSQLQFLFGGRQAMAESVREHARRVGRSQGEAVERLFPIPPSTTM